MTSSESDIVALLMQHPELREKLYARGFLATDAAIDFMKHPFYNLWTRYEWRGGTVFCAPGQRATVCEQNDYTAWQLKDKIEIRYDMFGL